MPCSSNCRFRYIVLVFFILSACKPAIYNFNVSPPVIVGDQKVLIDFDVKGKASVEFNEHMSPDSIQLLEYTLIVTKVGKEARKTVQVQKLKPQALIDITFATSSLEADFVVASGENNNNQWSRFQLVSVSNPMSREVIVLHNGKSVTLKIGGASSQELSGITAGGVWTLKSRLTAEEKADSSRILQELTIKAAIKPLNP